MIFSILLSLFIIFAPQVANSPTSDGLNKIFGENLNIFDGDGNQIVDNNNSTFSPVTLPRAEPRPPKKKEESKSLGIETTARAVAIIDEASGEVLFEKNGREALPMASLTKLMTVLVFLDHNPGWDEKITLLRSDDRDGGIFYTHASETVLVKDLFNMTLVGSVNNASVALARSTKLDLNEFVLKMNEKKDEIKMNNFHFVDPTGLEPGNTGTAREIAKLLAHTLGKDEVKEAVIKKTYVFSPVGSNKVYYVKSTNELLWSFLGQEPYKFVGGKTGYIEESGYNLAVEVQRDGHKIVVVVLGSDTAADRFQEVKGLADWVFDNYYWE